MGIVVNKDSRIVVQGVTGREGRFHTGQMVEYGTKVVAGCTPGKGGTDVDGIPVTNTVREAVERHGADVSCVFVPPAFAADAVYEAVAAGIKTVVCITDGIPIQDMAGVFHFAKVNGVTLIGPNCPGITTAEECKVGIIPGNIFKKGSVGLVSRSGTLTYEVVDMLTKAGLGETTCIGIGGDPIIGSTFIDLLPRFEADPETEAVVLIGEIGGSDEETAAEYIKNHMTKPVVGFIGGRNAPEGKRMGHAGALVSGGKGTAKSKIEALTAAGVPVADNPGDIVPLLKERL